jgi:hypothetical protein
VSLPKRYALSVEVKLIELPNQFDEPQEPISASDDPMQVAAALMNRAMAQPVAIPYQPAGFDFRKSATVTVQSFDGLANIIGQFSALTTQIEAERP